MLLSLRLPVCCAHLKMLSQLSLHQPREKYGKDSTQSTLLAEACDGGDFIERMKLLTERIKQIDMRLDAMGYKICDHPIDCPDLLMGYEESKHGMTVKSSSVDAGTYQRQMEMCLSEFKRTKQVLALKITEIEEKNVGKDDAMDFVWKEERDGVSQELTLKSYYDAHKTAMSNLVLLIESEPTDDRKRLFREKNGLVSEKIELLVKLRCLQLSSLPLGGHLHL